MLIRVTLAVDNSVFRKQLQAVLARPDVYLQQPRISSKLWKRVVGDPPDVLIISQSILPTPEKTMVGELQAHPDCPTSIVLTESTDLAEHARLLAEGCDAVLHVSLAVEQVRAVIESMLEKRRRLTQKCFFAPQPLAEPKLSDFVSDSPGMADFMNLVPRLVRSDTPLLIEGETGVGKERLAAAIHSEGLRTAGRFVALNCGALPEHLLESELFGHVRGAFTGATSARRGWFEMAHRGTLFLDEVGEVPLHLQVKLLRVLQEHEIQPVGAERTIGVDVRVIAASNRPLLGEVEAGRFRRDLYHRLGVVTVTVPPLRDRMEDIPTLVERHIGFIAKGMGRHVTGISEPAMKAMCSYTWPGNVRELNNVLERAILLCDNSEIGLDDLPLGIAGPVLAELGPSQGVASHCLLLPRRWLTMPLTEVRSAFLSDLERQYIEGLLKATRGRVGEAAARAGLQARSLYEKMKQFDLHKEDYRGPAPDKA